MLRYQNRLYVNILDNKKTVKVKLSFYLQITSISVFTKRHWYNTFDISESNTYYCFKNKTHIQ